MAINPLALKCVRAIEDMRNQKLIIKSTNKISEYDPNTFCIKIGKQRGIGTTWKDRLLFHEIGHAVIDTTWTNFDKASFKRIFKGLPQNPYQECVLMNYFSDTTFITRPSITFYGKSHPEEAWAEAFSFALANVDDSSENHEVVEQLSYADYVIRNLINNKRTWGRFIMPTSTVHCPHCGNKNEFYSRGETSSTLNWVIECNHCQECMTLLD